MNALALIALLAATAPGQAKGPDLQNPALAGDRLVLETNFGDMAFVLYPEIAPRHVAQVANLARLGVYDGINIYRVEKGFVAQVSNEFDRLQPLTEQQAAAIRKIPAEFSALPHQRGVLSMARYDDPDSAQVSFSILLGPAPHLDRQYTIFGRLDQGADTLTQIEQVPVDESHVPQTKVTVLRAAMVPAGQVAQYFNDHPHSVPDQSGLQLKSLSRSNLFAAYVFALITLLAFAVVLMDPKRNRERTALSHLILLVSGVGVLALTTPRIQFEYQYLGVALFFGLVAIFKVLGRFDSPD